MPDTGLLTFTRQGNMANGLAGLRPSRAPIYAMTNSVETLRQLRLLRSVEPFLLEHQSHPNRTVEGALALLQKNGYVVPGDKLIVATDMITAERLVDSIQLRVVI
jgi:pyruvate kinase